ncbi:ubiquinol-cytochrome c reductase iron-sulfur subunit [Alkalilimnicola sp. S0819]|uniref:ubiquinol-cytochrome c reductase iron-sulfur subunit n=1 Tax=Alkalilimnicola sp. S0819 TaxID=2613922 RepID=UPI0012624EE1|nr:ubiquinol-cytochrome c reductase iron-sulfur subunit [Alkalilimnicola sp. S0819]KAB7623838.1 ubiquinol-cytochrome c reductase iron-sulfur subunit [Alkalilimnicola sp. S0819]MPQ16714.1 ubiquinol-cytochrome c reductase iron-sulfur subunit [Alkalilimnicola sp. S0819]
MNHDGADKSRRRFLTAAATVVGGVGVAYTAVPFLASWKPSARAQAAGAPVEVDISKLEPGQRVNAEWRGRPIWVVRRTDEMLERLNTVDDQLADPASEVPQQPDYAQNQYRSIKPEYMVLIGICTHLGCSPLFRPEPDAADLGPNWPGGFFCPCHGSKFDLAGRVWAGVPAPTNMEVPPYYFVNENTILVGEDKGAA